MNKNINDNLITQLRAKVEGRNLPGYGYTIAITAVHSYSDGLIDINDASTHFTVTFDALMFRLFKDEIAMCRVVRVTREGVSCMCGPAQVFIHVRNFGFAAEFEDIPHDRPRFLSGDDTVQEGTMLRVLIMNESQSADASLYIGRLNSIVN